MRGKVDSGSLVTVEPIKDKKTLRKGDIVLCTVKGREYLHLIKVIFAHCEKDYRYEIGNNRGGINGFIGPNRIYGLCTKVEK